MKQHWKILLWMVAGTIVGGVFQYRLEAPAHAGIGARTVEGRLVVSSAAGPARIGKLAKGDILHAVILKKGRKGLEDRRLLRTPADLDMAVADSSAGDILWFEASNAPGARLELRPVTLVMTEDAPRRKWVAPFAFLATMFMSLLKMLIVPLVLTSIISGVAGVGALGDLRRMGLKTLAYYVTTSLFAILVGQSLVNIVRPGDGAELGLPPSEKFAEGPGDSFIDIFIRMIPENIFAGLADNGSMLQIIFFGMIFGIAITQASDPHRTRIFGFFESAFDIMMQLAGLVLRLIPYGAFSLLVKVVGETGFGLFVPLAKYMLMIAAGLLIHGCIILPLILRFVAGINPLVWFRTMGPALMTAFSASSSSMTLPVTMDCVERGGVSNKTASFVLPLGATINMDGTALYECAGVIFLAQYYASTSDYVLTFGAQLQVVFMALFASIGAAGIPSAGLVMMLTILVVLKLPIEGAALLLAVDRPLDMMRTMVNVLSDSVGAAVIGRSEGDKVEGQA
ncbi:MAG: dicarboxylate/amino acid:cation symporter [Planctomycetota bacterium]